MEEQIITQERSQAYTEILEILKVLGDNYTYKIPKKLIEYFEKNSLKDYKFNIDYTADISKQIRNPITINLIGMLKYRFWCSNEEEKKILVNKFIENDKRRERELRAKYHLLSK